MEIGDIVYLNSGSPPLTVIAKKANLIRVGWIWTDLYSEALFPEICLRTTPPTEYPRAQSENGKE